MMTTTATIKKKRNFGVKTETTQNHNVTKKHRYSHRAPTPPFNMKQTHKYHFQRFKNTLKIYYQCFKT